MFARRCPYREEEEASFAAAAEGEEEGGQVPELSADALGQVPESGARAQSAVDSPLYPHISKRNDLGAKHLLPDDDPATDDEPAEEAADSRADATLLSRNSRRQRRVIGYTDALPSEIAAAAAEAAAMVAAAASASKSAPSKMPGSPLQRQQQQPPPPRKAPALQQQPHVAHSAAEPCPTCGGAGEVQPAASLPPVTEKRSPVAALAFVFLGLAAVMQLFIMIKGW
jgi:hypothetical protein